MTALASAYLLDSLLGPTTVFSPNPRGDRCLKGPKPVAMVPLGLTWALQVIQTKAHPTLHSPFIVHTIHNVMHTHMHYTRIHFEYLAMYSMSYYHSTGFKEIGECVWAKDTADIQPA